MVGKFHKTDKNLNFHKKGIIDKEETDCDIIIINNKWYN